MTEHDHDPYEGVEGLSRFERGLSAAASREPDGWLRRHWRLATGGAIAILLGAGLTMGGPAFGLLEREYDHSADLELASEWGCKSALALPEGDGTGLQRCGNVPREIAAQFAGEEISEGWPGPNVGVDTFIIVVDGGSPRLGPRVLAYPGVATLADFAEIDLQFDRTFPPREGPTGPSGPRGGSEN